MCYIASIMSKEAKKGIATLRRHALPDAMRCALIQARKKCGRSQRDLAARLGIGQPHIAGIDAGKIEPHYDTMHHTVRTLVHVLLLAPPALHPRLQSLVRH